MTIKQKASAKKTYCVWADYVRRMFQHVEARSPKEAHQIACEHPECWQSCDHRERNFYRPSNEVQDLKSDEFFAMDGHSHCKACGSEIVETINDSNFRDGEYGPCEYQRYMTQPNLQRACEMMATWIENLPRSVKKKHFPQLTDPEEIGLLWVYDILDEANGKAA